MSAKMKQFGPIILIVLIVLAVGFWLFWQYFDVYHFAVVQPKILYRDGVRSIHEFDLTARKAHIKTVISLVDDGEIQKSPFTDELAYCQSHGINVVRIPVTLGGWPSSDQIRQFLSVVNDPNQQPVLVHCAQGVRRTGMMIAAYQRTELKMSKDQCGAAILSFGHSQRTIGDVLKFIDVYDPAEQRMTEDLPVSKE
jgi:protein tyrosine/serine phosphatase